MDLDWWSRLELTIRLGVVNIVVCSGPGWYDISVHQSYPAELDSSQG